MTHPGFLVESVIRGKIRTCSAGSWSQACRFAEEERQAGADYVAIRAADSGDILQAASVLDQGELFPGQSTAARDAIRGGL